VHPSDPSSSYYLAIDQGGHASRAIVFDRYGHLVAGDQCKIRINHHTDDWIEYDPEELLASIINSIHNAIGKVGEISGDIVAAGLATQRSNIICWDRQTGVPLSPIISWQDRRAYKWLEKFSSYNDRIHTITGLYPNAHYGVSKLRWCLDNLPAVKEAHKNGTLMWGPMSSFLCRRLLDEETSVADPVNASRTLLWDIASNDWSQELLELFDLPPECLPACVPSDYHFGTLEAGPCSMPMTIVTGDQSAALYAAGRPKPEYAYITIGTGAFIARITGHQPVISSRLLSSIVNKTGETPLYALEGTVNGAGSALSWVSIKTGLYQKMEQLPRWLAHNSNPPLFLNGVSGLGTPVWKPHFPPAFIGDGEDWEKVVAVIESIVFLLQLNLEEMCKSVPLPERINIGGGLSRFDGLCARLANISGIPVHRSNMHENTALGLAYLLADFPSTWPDRSTDHVFDPVKTPSLYDRYMKWKRALYTAIETAT